MSTRVAVKVRATSRQVAVAFENVPLGQCSMHGRSSIRAASLLARDCPELLEKPQIVVVAPPFDYFSVNDAGDADSGERLSLPYRGWPVLLTMAVLCIVDIVKTEALRLGARP